MTSVLEDLVSLSRELGRPDLDLAILGEGNTSARADGDTFWVKASGTSLALATAETFVAMQRGAVLDMLEAGALTDQDVRERLQAARVAAGARTPSIETLLHAVCLSLPGVSFVGHTHPTAVTAIACSLGFPEVLRGRLFPDEIVVCGPAPVLVGYADPGVPLARAVRDALAAWQAEHRDRPRAIWMQNHGLVALGDSRKQVLDITLMTVKAARTLAGTAAFGGPRYLSATAAARIHTRPDEHYRQRNLGGS